MESNRKSNSLNLNQVFPEKVYAGDTHPTKLSAIREKSFLLSWEEVQKIHKIRNGVYQRNGQLISLLTDFGVINPCYPDVHGETSDTILYTGAGRRGDQKLDAPNRALLRAIETKIKVPLFNKLSAGRWEFLGFWRVVDGKYIFDEKQDRMIWQFTLVRIDE